MWCMPGKEATVPEPQMGADDRMGCTPAAMPRDHRAVVRSRQRPWRIGSALFAVAVTVISIAFIAADLHGRENGPSAGNVGSASNKSEPVAGGVGSASKTSTHTPGRATTVRSALSSPIAIASGADIGDLCSKPSSQFGRFWIISAGSSQEQDHGTVDIGGTTVPAAAIYTSSGKPGIGVLCVSNLSISPSSPVRPVPEASGRPIAYLAADEQGRPYLAVKPGVTTVTLSTSGENRYTYTLTSTGELQLQQIGAGWHAVSVGYGMPSTTVVITAYNAGGDLLDTRELKIP